MSAHRTAPEVIGRTLANLIPLALMIWAATETTGVLRWALIGWSTFSVCVYAALATGWKPDEDGSSTEGVKQYETLYNERKRRSA